MAVDWLLRWVSGGRDFPVSGNMGDWAPPMSLGVMGSWMLTLDAVDDVRDISGTSFTHRGDSDRARDAVEIFDMTDER
jgi:hypothetical protein